MTKINCNDLVFKDWYAWNDLGLPEPFFFNITFNVEITNLGQVVYLEEIIPPGYNANDIPLKIHVFQKPGHWSSVLKTINIRFSKQIENYRYETATVFCNNEILEKLIVDQIR